MHAALRTFSTFRAVSSFVMDVRALQGHISIGCVAQATVSKGHVRRRSHRSAQLFSDRDKGLPLCFEALVLPRIALLLLLLQRPAGQSMHVPVHQSQRDHPGASSAVRHSRWKPDLSLLPATDFMAAISLLASSSSFSLTFSKFCSLQLQL